MLKLTSWFVKNHASSIPITVNYTKILLIININELFGICPNCKCELDI